MSIDKEEIKKLFGGEELICINDFVAYQKAFFNVGQSEIAKMCGITQGQLSTLSNKRSKRANNIFVTQDKAGKVAIFELKRIDKSKAKVDRPRLVMPKRAKP